MNNNRQLIPVAVFTYNRPEHTKCALAALANCRRSEECIYFLYSDDAKTEDARAAVDATREVLHDWARSHDAQVIERRGNWGLAKSVVSGVSDLCGRYGQVIVLEDDLIVSPDFLDYMIESLEKYADCDQVMQIGGFTIAPPKGLATDAFFLPVTSTWGWATWQRAWQHFSWEPADYEVAKLDRDWSDLFNLNGAWTFSSMLEDRLAGRNDSWGILWWYAVSRHRGLVLYPAQSMVWNGGFDGTGIHCGDGGFLQQGEATRYREARVSGAVRLPSQVAFDHQHLATLEQFFRASQAPNTPCEPSPGILQRVRRPLGKVIRKIKHAIR